MKYLFVLVMVCVGLGIVACGNEPGTMPSSAPADDDYLHNTIPPDAEERELPVRPSAAFPPALRGYFVKREKVGTRTFHGSGKMASETPMRNGKAHGVRREWDEEGHLTAEKPYKNGLPHGTTKQWDSQGKLLDSSEMTMGTGVMKEWWPNGNLKEEIACTNGRWDGVSREWFENGSLKEEMNYDHETVEGFTRAYYQDGHPMQTGRYRKGVSHGIWRIWGESGQLLEGTPTFWRGGNQVTRDEYIAACEKDPTLPKYNPDDDKPGPATQPAPAKSR